MTTAVAPVSPLELDRRRYRAGRARRSAVIAAASTVVVAAVLYLGVTHAPGWAAARATYFDLHVADTSFGALLRAFWLNIRVLVVSAVIIVVLSAVVATVRTLRGPVWFPLRALATAYVDFFRGIPLIVLLYLVGFGIPVLRVSWLPRDPTLLGAIALILQYTAYVAEVFRAGIGSVHPTQRTAAASIGLTYVQSLRLVVFPQAVRRVIPALLNDFVSLQKDVGLISVLGAVDVVRQAQIINGQDFNFTPYVVAGLLFIVIAIPFTRVADAAAARATRREQAGSVV